MYDFGTELYFHTAYIQDQLFRLRLTLNEMSYQRVPACKSVLNYIITHIGQGTSVAQSIANRLLKRSSKYTRGSSCQLNTLPDTIHAGLIDIIANMPSKYLL